MRIRLLVMLALGLLSSCGGAGPAVMEFVELLPAQPRIGEVVTVRYRLLDSRGLPLAGQSVDFKLQGAGADGSRVGVKLSPTTASSQRGTGYAETQLVASGRVNAVTVVATAGDKQVASSAISFAGTTPSAKQFTFQCGPVAGEGSGGRHAIGAYDATRSLIAGVKIECTAHTGDRNGDGVSGALVSFLVEAGTVGPSAISQSDAVGNATVLYKTSLPLPVEVAPGLFTWTPTAGVYLAPLWMHPYEWVENPATPTTAKFREPRRFDPIRMQPNNTRFENNPRDNLVTMIAVTSGEEAFSDRDNNGIYEEGIDAFDLADDLGEPFVDANDNGIYDNDERFIDVDGDKAWSPGDEKWSGNTLIWVQERLLWTGMPAQQDAVGEKPIFVAIKGPITLRCLDTLPVGSPCYQATDATGANARVTAFLADPWFNSMARNSDGDGCVIEIAGKAPVVLKASAQPGIAFTYPAGENFTFEVGDARDPNLPPAQQIPKRGFPISFSVPITCTYTASPLEGHVVKVSVGNIVGTID